MAAEFPYQWKKRYAITIDHTKVGADLSDFQVTLLWTGSTSTSNLPQSMFDTTGTYPANSNGSDVRFTSDKLGESQLSFEIVSFSTSSNPANDRAEIYVKLTTVSSATDTVFYMWWGNTSATAYAATHAYGRNAVWSDSVWVLHLTETSGTALDSTGNGHDGTYVGNIPNLTTGGPLNNFQRFERTNSGISLGNSNGLPSGNTFNFMFLMANNWGADSWQYLYTKQWSSNARFQRWGNSNYHYIQPEPNGETYGGSNVNDGTFRTTHYHFDQTDGTRVRLNGTVDLTNTGTTALATRDSPQTIGYNDTFTNGIDSDFAEIRYRETTRTVGWMTSETNTLNSPATFAYLSSDATIAPIINAIWFPNPQI